MESLNNTNLGAALESKPLLHTKKAGIEQKLNSNLLAQQLATLTKDELLKYNISPNLRAFEKEKYELIETEDALRALSAAIANESAIGIDIEQTSTNTYYGYICVIQISTQSKDYVIDAIKLHDLIPKYLNAIFANTKIVKIFYSGASDLLWLDRDFGIQVINYFDVHLASIYLDKNRDNSLIGLLSEYCSYSLDKATKKFYQLSDWRVRPLTCEQLEYAALDAHYLIYLRDVLLAKIHEKTTWDSGLKAFLLNMQKNCLKQWDPKPLSLVGYEEYFLKYVGKGKPDIKKEHLSKTDKKGLSGEYIEELNKFLNLVELRNQAGLEFDQRPEVICSNEQLIGLVMESSTTKNQEKEEEHKLDIEKNLFLNTYTAEIKRILDGKNVKKIALVSYKGGLDSHLITNTTRKVEYKDKSRKKGKAYESCRILSPDNSLLCYCNSSKIDWYLKRNLGEVVQDNPRVLRLKFEPAGRGMSELNELKLSFDEYMKTDRINQCVVCGQQENYLKYHVVPLLYRVNFPDEMKAHRSHDIILLCVRCLEKANKEAEKMKLQLAKKYNVPLLELNDTLRAKNDLDQLKKGLISLKKNFNTIPKERKELLISAFQELFQKIFTDENNHLKEEFKQELLKLEREESGKVKLNEKFQQFFIRIPDFKEVMKNISGKDFRNLHGKLVVDHLDTKEKMLNFVNEWRQFFLETMDPQFLPHDWKAALQKKVAE